MEFLSSTDSSPNATMTPDEVAAYLSHLSEASFANRYPVVVYLGMLVLVGLVGNSLVLAVYSLRFPPSATRVFVLAMAVCDLITSLVANPLQLATIRYAYNTYSYWFCRGFFVFSLLPTHTSGALLVLVSLDRYRRICRPLASQLNSRQALRLVLAASAACVVIYTPFVPLYGLHYVPTEVQGVYASMCWNDSGHMNSPYFKAYVAIVGIVFFGELLVMGLAYSLIGRRVWRQTKKRRGQYVAGRRRLDKTRNARLSAEKIEQKHAFSSSSDPGYNDTDKESTSRDEVKQPEHHSTQGDSTSATFVSLDQSSKLETDSNPVGASGVKAEPPENGEKTADLDTCIGSQTTAIKNAQDALNTSPGSKTDSARNEQKTDLARNEQKNKDLNKDSETCNLDKTNLDNPSRPVSLSGSGRPGTGLSAETCVHSRAGKAEDESDTDQKGKQTHQVSGQDLEHTSGQTVKEDSDTKGKEGPPKCEPPTSSHQVVESKTGRNRKIRSQTTLMMAALTGLYVINWLPHLVMRSLTDDPVNMCDGLTSCGYNTVALTTRSYYLNSAVNAFVYGFCNERFRVQCRLLFRSVFHRLTCRSQAG